MSNTSPSKEKYCSLISEIIGNSTDIIVEKETVLDYDAVELTLLLKSIGFQLVSLDFDSIPTERARDIEVEIRCKQSGIHSKLLMSAEKCTCPIRKAINNNSFWEVQGIAPSTPVDKNKGIVQDTSCNLLPDVSKKTTSLGKTMMTVLLQHYQADFEPKGEQIKTVDVKQLVDRLQEINHHHQDLINTSEKPLIDLHSAGLTTVVPPKNFISPADNGEALSICSTPLSSINVTPVPSSNDNTTDLIAPKICVQSLNDNENLLIENEKPPDTSNPRGSTEVVFTTPTENEATFENMNAENERDVCLIEAISDARKQLDSALLMLKCNITRNLSQSSFLTVTPQVAKKPPTPKKNTNFSRPANRRLSADGMELRRHSYGARQEVKSKVPLGALKTSSSSGAVNEIKKKALNFPLPVKISKGDTPRPGVPKKTTDKPPVVSKIAIKRATSVTSLKGSTSSTKALGAKNPAKEHTPSAARKL